MNKNGIAPQPSFHFNSSPSFKIETSVWEIRNNWKCLLSNYGLKRLKCSFSLRQYSATLLPTAADQLSSPYCRCMMENTFQANTASVAVNNLRTVEASTDSDSHSLLYILSPHYFPGTGDFFSFKEESLKAPQLSRSFLRWHLFS